MEAKLINIDQYTKDEKSLLLFFETCLVDNTGRVKSVHMNGVDMDIAKKMQKDGLIEFGRLKFSVIKKQNNRFGSTHWVRFSKLAWILAHAFRKERSERILEYSKEKLISEMTKTR